MCFIASAYCFYCFLFGFVFLFNSDHLICTYMYKTNNSLTRIVLNHMKPHKGKNPIVMSFTKLNKGI